MRSKRGELTTTQIVTITILLVSFIVILFFIFRLNFTETSDAELCHSSVILSRQANLPGFNKGLNCRTKYVCISAGNKCSDINPTETIEITSGNPEEIKDEIYGALADEMSRCWWMFGEGEVDYLGKLERHKGGVHCGICDVVKFSDDIDAELSYAEFYKYLEKTKKDETQTYLSYLYGVYDLSSLKRNAKFNSEVINLSKKYVVVTGWDTRNDAAPDFPITPSFILNDQTESILGCTKFDLIKAS